MSPRPRLSPERHTHISSHLLNISESALARPIDKSRRILISQLFSHLHSHFPARLLCLGVLAFLFTCCSGQKILPLPTDFKRFHPSPLTSDLSTSTTGFFLKYILYPNTSSPFPFPTEQPYPSQPPLAWTLAVVFHGCPLVSPSPQPRYGEDNNSGVRMIKKKMPRRTCHPQLKTVP